MWVPKRFRMDDREALHALIREHSFGILFSADGERPWATHLPFLIDGDRGPHGTLVGHMARANPHWRTFREDTMTLTVFQGPHAYVSPAWYRDPVTVPTWNYAVVHVYGIPELIHDAEGLRAIVERQVEKYEAGRSPRWEIATAAPILESELAGIVGFEIPIERLEGKFKLNQNLSVADREGVMRALEGSEDPLERGIAELMALGLPSAPRSGPLPR